MKKKLFIPLSLFIIACTPDPPEPVPPVEGTMTCNLNGSPWSASSTRAELQIIEDVDGIVKRIDIYGTTGSGFSIGLGCVSEDTDTNEDIPTGLYTEDSEEKPTVIALSQGLSPEGGVDGFYEDSAKVNITSINAATKKCSGTFEFWAHEWAGPEITHIATGGVFTDVIFEVID